MSIWTPDLNWNIYTIRLPDFFTKYSAMFNRDRIKSKMENFFYICIGTVPFSHGRFEIFSKTFYRLYIQTCGPIHLDVESISLFSRCFQAPLFCSIQSDFSARHAITQFHSVLLPQESLFC